MDSLDGHPPLPLPYPPPFILNPSQELPWDEAEQSWVLLAAGWSEEQVQEFQQVLFTHFPHH